MPACRGNDAVSNRIALREGQLIDEIALLERKVSGVPDADDARRRHARTYLKELLRFKQEMLELARYRRAGRGARWERRPELR
jgi:hypothetical protein